MKFYVVLFMLLLSLSTITLEVTANSAISPTEISCSDSDWAHEAHPCNVCHLGHCGMLFVRTPIPSVQLSSATYVMTHQNLIFDGFTNALYRPPIALI